MISSEPRPSHIRTGGQFENVFLGPRPVFQKLREDAQSERSASGRVHRWHTHIGPRISPVVWLRRHEVFNL